MKLFSASLWAGHRNSLCIFLAAWSGSRVWQMKYAVMAVALSLSCEVTRLCVAWAGCRERAMQHRLMSHQGGMSAGLCSPASLAHRGLVTPLTPLTSSASTVRVSNRLSHQPISPLSYLDSSGWYQCLSLLRQKLAAGLPNTQVPMASWSHSVRAQRRQEPCNPQD